MQNLEKPWKNHAYHAVKMKKSQTMERLPGIKDKYTDDRKRWRENYLVMDACDTPLVQVRPSQFSKLQTQSVLACSAWDAMYNLVLGAPSEPVSCAHTHFCKRRSLGKERLVEDICQLSHLRLHQVSKWQNVGVTWGNIKLDYPTMSPYTTLTVPRPMACASVARQTATESRTFLSPMPLQRSSSYGGQQGQRQESKTKARKTLQLRLPLGWLLQHLPMTCNRQLPLQPFS